MTPKSLPALIESQCFFPFMKKTGIASTAARLEPLFASAQDHDVTLQTAADYAGSAVNQLEANRDRLYGFEPKNPA